MRILRNIIAIAPFLLCYCIAHAQSPVGNVVLSTQDQIHDFVAAHPNCSEITGNVTIGIPYGSTDVYDLQPLNNIRTIRGYLTILNNPELQSLEGLENLISIGGYLIIYNNDGLKHINELQNLSKTGGSLWVIKNESISSIVGLESVKSINGSLDIYDNPALVSLQGIQNIDYASIKPTLDFQSIKMIDIRTEVDHKLITDEWSTMLYNLTNLNLAKRFQGLLSKPYSKRAVETDLLYRKMESITDSIRVHAALDQFEDMARNSRVGEMTWEVELLRSFWQLKNGSASLNHRIGHIQNLANTAGLKGELLVQARALKFISYKYLLELQEYESIFSNYQALEQVLNQLSPDEFPDMAQCYMLMGRAHYFFKDYRQAIRFFGKAAKLPKIPFNTTFIKHSLNNMGLSYRNLNIPDSSDFYFKQVLRDTTVYPINVWEGIASGNLGHNYYRRGEYQHAIPLLERDIHNGVAMDDLGLASGGLISLADIHLKLHALDDAKFHIDSARACIQRSGQTERLRLLFPIITKWYAAMGQREEVDGYIDSTQLIIQSYNESISALKLLRARQEFKAALRINELEQRQLMLQRNLVITTIILLIIIVSIFLWYRNINSQRKQQLHELQLRNAQDSLDNARSRLAEQAKKISENDKVIHRLKQNFKGHLDPPVLQELKNSTILTDEDWVMFKKNFQKAYPGFLNTLMKSYPGLTHAELRLLCLLKLGLTNREMAMVQGISPKSIYVTNHRIRKKLNIKTQNILESLVKELT